MDNNVKVPYTTRERPSDIRLINKHDFLGFSSRASNFTTKATNHATAAGHASATHEEVDYI